MGSSSPPSTQSCPTTGDCRPPGASARPFRLRTVVEGGVLVLLVVGLVETWLIGGSLVPYRVAGGSMAETLLGTHREVICGDCGFPFPCGTDVLPVAPRAACPNCGYPANPLEALPEVAGQRVLMDRAVFALRPPQRWEIVAFRPSRQAENTFVKRVVGLPGESIEIRHGDVYANGRLQRKTLAQQQAMAVLVHDANFQPTQKPTPPPRWQAPPRTGPFFGEKTHSLDRHLAENRDLSPSAAWKAGDGHFFHAADPKESDDPKVSVDWLEYHHWRRLPAGGVQPSPVTDLCSYNASQPQRDEEVHAVADLMLSLRLEHNTGSGQFLVRIADGHDAFEAQLSFHPDPQLDKRAVVEYSAAWLKMAAGETIAHAPIGTQPVKYRTLLETETERTVVVSLVDQQFVLAIDGQTIVAWPYERPDGCPAPPSCPLAIGAQGIAATVRDLRVWRDVYYTEPAGAGPRRGGRPILCARRQ
jgi:signal peptidase I